MFSAPMCSSLNHNSALVKIKLILGGVDKGLMYARYVPVNHANKHARTTFKHGLYNSMVRAST